MSYGDARAFLAKHTKLVELADNGGARVAICPDWQGRVMTSTFGGADGPDFGFINRPFIEAGQLNPQFNNYGGEERMWLSPEGGQFSLMFDPGAEQSFENWRTPPALNETTWDVKSGLGTPHCRITTRINLQNASATEFDLNVTRDVRLVTDPMIEQLFGNEVLQMLGQPSVSKVGYETVNTVTNQGPAMTREGGLVSIWILGMLNASPQTVVIVPYRPGNESDLGPVVKSDYFGQIPAERLKITPRAVLFAADAKHRAKIGTSQRRAKSVLGSIDFAASVLTVVQFTMSDDPVHDLYMNNMWEVPQEEPYVGDVANAYNDGPNSSGDQLGEFYEIESLSPATELKNGDSLTHRHRTFHIQAEMPILVDLAKEILGVDLADVRNEMLP